MMVMPVIFFNCLCGVPVKRAVQTAADCLHISRQQCLKEEKSLIPWAEALCHKPHL